MGPKLLCIQCGLHSTHTVLPAGARHWVSNDSPDRQKFTCDVTTLCWRNSACPECLQWERTWQACTWGLQSPSRVSVPCAYSSVHPFSITHQPGYDNVCSALGPPRKTLHLGVISGAPTHGHVTLGKCLDLGMPQFSHLRNGCSIYPPRL